MKIGFIPFEIFEAIYHCPSNTLGVCIHSQQFLELLLFKDWVVVNLHHYLIERFFIFYYYNSFPIAAWGHTHCSLLTLHLINHPHLRSNLRADLIRSPQPLLTRILILVIWHLADTNFSFAYYRESSSGSPRVKWMAEWMSLKEICVGHNFTLKSKWKNNKLYYA